MRVFRTIVVSNHGKRAGKGTVANQTSHSVVYVRRKETKVNYVPNMGAELFVYLDECMHILRKTAIKFNIAHAQYDLSVYSR